ncbi:MAG: metallophosphoesterase [Actinobacteria bacterium]|nr:metallophosphoesterase [Actinomycetota bacterium]
MGLFSRNKDNAGERTKLFFATDLHSSEACFRKLLVTPRVYELDRVICGGDCTGKMLIPLVEQGEGSGNYLVEWGGESVVAHGEEEVAEHEKQIRYAGLYPVRIDEAEAARLASDPARLQALFQSRMLAVVGEWTALAEERLGGNGTQFVMTPGNDDEFEVDDVIKASSFVDAAENRVVKIGPHEMLSVGWSNTTPWNTPRECSEEELAGKIDALAAQIEDMSSAIFNIHVPPFGTGLDNAPKLDENLKPVEGGTVMAPVGSTAVRDSILKHQPLLALHGHIHESRGVQKLGRTTCINPGSVYGEGILQGVIVDLGPEDVRYTLTDG